MVLTDEGQLKIAYVFISQLPCLFWSQIQAKGGSLAYKTSSKLVYAVAHKCTMYLIYNVCLKNSLYVIESKAKSTVFLLENT